MTWIAAMLGMPAGDTRLLVGVEDDPDGSLRVYLNARYTGLHTHVDDEDAKTKARTAWASATGHTFVDVPDDALCDCRPELTPALATRQEPTS